MTFGYDPEVPAGYQDADIEMRELEEQARELAVELDAEPAQCNERQVFQIVGSGGHKVVLHCTKLEGHERQHAGISAIDENGESYYASWQAVKVDHHER